MTETRFHKGTFLLYQGYASGEEKKNSPKDISFANAACFTSQYNDSSYVIISAVFCKS